MSETLVSNGTVDALRRTKDALSNAGELARKSKALAAEIDERGAGDRSEIRFGVKVSPEDLAELARRLDEVTLAERSALEDITANPRIIGEKDG